jgi:hypothetical protein
MAQQHSPRQRYPSPPHAIAPSRILTVAQEHSTTSLKPSRLYTAAQFVCALPLAIGHTTIIITTSILDAVEIPLLAIKKASAEELNAWSLETFFDRTMQFVWVIAMLLTWTPFWIALPSLVS